MSKQLIEILGVLALAVGVVASGVWIVEVEHRSRQLFIQAEALSRELEEIEIDWGRLQIEQSTHGAHSLVETARPRAAATGGAERRPARSRRRARALRR